MAVDLSSIFPRKYLEKLLVLGIRADGRGQDAGRPVSLNVGSISTCDGSAVVRCGETIVLCGIKAELLPSGVSNCGITVCNVDLSSCCLPEANTGAPSVDVQVFTREIQALIDRFVDHDRLCVEKSELVWVLNVDMVCLSHCGNLMDACTLAAVAALQNVCLYSIDSDGSQVQVQLNPVHMPLLKTGFVTVSFALFRDWCLMDPVLAEETVAQGFCTVVITCIGTIVGFQHQGKAATEQQLSRLRKVASVRAASLFQLLNKTQ